ncbi:MAG: DNA alkylation repair protein [Halieaceae bacterium]|jgi:3-methyladenine DNA glycosylase AlkD|nr:DNA alkylation repair protein [Halieaceae bacterium]
MKTLQIQKDFRACGSKKIAAHSQRFFKTGKGEYGAGDLFLGIRVPIIRKTAKSHNQLSIKDTKALIKSRYHEERLLGLIILVNKYAICKSVADREKLYQVYVASFQYINNWDLVDVTCPHIVGRHLMERDRSILYAWAASDDLWTRRIAMIANWWFIRNGDLSNVFEIAHILLKDEHDLIHKAVGWMLREAWKKDAHEMEKFLKTHYRNMPRTMLRYAIEKMPESRRQNYLKGKI